MDAQFIERLAEICGPDHSLHSSKAIELYSRCTIAWSQTCGAVAFPDNVDQVSRIVRLCNESRLPVWFFSRGHNWGYGTVPSSAKRCSDCDSRENEPDPRGQ